MLKNTSFALAISLSLVLLSACGEQAIQQAVKVDSPKQTNSNNQTDQSQNNTGSGTQNNTSTNISSSGSGDQNVNLGSGNQTNTSTTNTNSGSGTQTNTTVNGTNSGDGNQVINTNTGSGQLISPVNNGSGNQTNNINTGSGNQTIVNGNQTNNNTTINYNITYIQQFNTKLVYNLNQEVKLETNWDAVPDADKYAVYLNNQFYQEVNTPSVSIVLPNNEQTQNATIGVAALPVGVSKSELPAPPPTYDLSVIGTTSFSGTIYEDTGAPLKGARVSVKSLNASIPFESQTTTGADGHYNFNFAPSGVQIEIRASKEGYTVRYQVGTMQPNPSKSASINRFDFSGEANALSDKPEVVSVWPGRNASGVNPDTSFVLKFSEPMDRASVQNNFIIYSFNNKQFTVDTSGSTTVSGNGDVNVISGTPIWDKTAFNITWNSDDTEATFIFKEGYALPSDRNSSNVPDYRVALNRDDDRIRDASGVSRGAGEKKFKLTNGNFEASYRFSIDPDDESPDIDYVSVKTAENGNSSGDMIKIRFSKPMIYYFPFGPAIPNGSPAIAGGMGGDISQAAAAFHLLPSSGVADNYTVSVYRAGTPILNKIGWGNLGGSAVFDTNDSSHKTVLLLPHTAGTDLFKPGDEVTVKVADSIVDPAGNRVVAASPTPEIAQ